MAAEGLTAAQAKAWLDHVVRRELARIAGIHAVAANDDSLGRAQNERHNDLVYGHALGILAEDGFGARIEEAEHVRTIFRLYARSSSTAQVLNELHARGIRTKRGAVFDRGYLLKFPDNKVYLGLAVHKDEVYPGEHQPIIDLRGSLGVDKAL